ncbi:hypothetical protein GALMADRAFT_137587 [Galerina marginata CBS 339.88]|uniref:Uncharacterized protein n=1 Tax=Galerina marginata (strain CBS 339.88) TaxID=685588 RepID=A0A067TF67_GALM3|nr:hypothetical protein GALMADRAFT_137587 [Galerina marginata CBS 339.88]
MPVSSSSTHQISASTTSTTRLCRSTTRQPTSFSAFSPILPTICASLTWDEAHGAGHACGADVGHPVLDGGFGYEAGASEGSGSMDGEGRKRARTSLRLALGQELSEERKKADKQPQPHPSPAPVAPSLLISDFDKSASTTSNASESGSTTRPRRLLQYCLPSSRTRLTGRPSSRA